MIYSFRTFLNIILFIPPYLYILRLFARTNCYIQNTYARRKKNKAGTLLNSFDSHRQNMELKIEINSAKFFDFKMIRIDNIIKTQVYTKEKKFPVHRTSKIWKKCRHR